MDLNEYLPMFLAEADEHLQELNLAVVRIEEQPDDTETINEIFRIAHSFKGMSATMGFEGIAKLTHTMEDVFELLRQRRGGLSREAIGVVLECLDALQAAVGRIEADGQEALDPDALVERLTALTRGDDPDDGPRDAPEGPHPVAVVQEALGAGARVLHLRLTLDAECAMPGVRAYMAYAALGDDGDVLAAAPGEDELEGFAGGEVQVWLASEHEEETLRASLETVPDVVGVEVTELGAAPPAAPAAPTLAAVPDAAPPAPVVALPVPAAGAPAAEPPVDAGRPAAERGTGARKQAATVRVDAERLDGLMHLMGELVVHRTRVESVAARTSDAELSQAVQDLARSSQALQAMVMQVRMVPVEAVLLRFPRLVRDLSVKLGKQVELSLVGKETELDRSVIDSIGDPLVHLVRNALDHGCETPAEREAAGKPPTARLELSARHVGGRVLLEVRDDGRGIDPAAVAAVAVKRGLIGPEAAASVDMARAIELLFAPGFSTAEKTTDISGRGVGMDAVRDAVRELGGEVVLQSQQGQGTVAQIRLPLTLAIVAALLVEIGGQPFALPLDRVESTLRLDEEAVSTVAGRRVLPRREGVLALCDAGSLGLASGEERFAVIVRADERRLALGVERLLGQAELVTRPLPSSLDHHPAVSAAAVLAEGGIALIVDCDALEASGAHVSPSRIAA